MNVKLLPIKYAVDLICDNVFESIAYMKNMEEEEIAALLEKSIRSQSKLPTDWDLGKEKPLREEVQPYIDFLIDTLKNINFLEEDTFQYQEIIIDLVCYLLWFMEKYEERTIEDINKFNDYLYNFLCDLEIDDENIDFSIN